MNVFYSEAHRAHDPPFEVFDGGSRVPYLENPDRAERILHPLTSRSWIDVQAPTDFGLDPVQAVHDAGYLDFLLTGWTSWRALSNRPGAASDSDVLLPATFALRRAARPTSSLSGKAGYYIMDLSACIVD